MTRVVYFIKPVEEAGPVKIGSTNDLQKRLHTLLGASPVDLLVAASVPGSFALERRLHSRFAYAHLRREWFHPVSELLAGVHALQQGADVEQAFDLSRPTGSLLKGAPHLLKRFTPQYRQRLSYARRFLVRERKLWGSDKAEYHVPLAVREILDSGCSQIPLTNDEIAVLDAALSELTAVVARSQA